MSDEKDSLRQGLETWLSGKPYWEQFLWKLNLEKESLTPPEIEQCYDYLREHLGTLAPSSLAKPPISFKNKIPNPSNIDARRERITIREVKNFVGVNALSPSCSLQVGRNLTLVYGNNGSGKSGIGRLLGNACFSRGDREILPNVKDNTGSSDQRTRATFVIEDERGLPVEVEYNLNDDNDLLKRFSVFDSKSVVIHLDESNKISFTPSQVRIFDKVAETLAKLETKLTNEMNAKRKDNPFKTMFLESDTSETALFCRNVDAKVADKEFLKHASFDPTLDGEKIASLEAEIDQKKKLDIPKRKSQLVIDCQNLTALKATLVKVTDCLSTQRMEAANLLVADILEKRTIVASLGSASFDDGLFKRIGSSEWKALLTAAKSLYDAEKAANNGNELADCILCHQKLSEGAKSLFQRYWTFLQSKAESELTSSLQKQTDFLRQLRSVKAVYPQFLATDAGIKVLNDDDPTYLNQLKQQFEAASAVLEVWISRVGQLETVDLNALPSISLAAIDTLKASKSAEKDNLIDPTSEIVALGASLNSLRHKKQVTAVRDAGLEYLAFLRWQSKANRAGFAGLKMATTKKRTEYFLAGVAMNYKGVFNQELAKLGCDFNLVMNASGEQGNTVKEYRLDFAENYNPSQILSEGEQNACSLADFLTEAQLDGSNCGLIFDDPVSSLDHERKDKIAERLVSEALERQVVVMTHDVVFITLLVDYAYRKEVPLEAHWMRRVNGVPGVIANNSSPKLALMEALKRDSDDAVKGFEKCSPKEQEQSLDAAFGYLRSACEAMIPELLFAKTIQRWDDQVRVQNLEEAVFDRNIALKIVDFHGRLSGLIIAHNKSSAKLENQPSLVDFNRLRSEFDSLEKELKGLKSEARKARESRKKSQEGARGGW